MELVCRKIASLLYRIIMVAIIVIVVFSSKIPLTVFYHRRALIVPNCVFIIIGVLLLLLLKKLLSDNIVTRINPFIMFGMLFVLSLIVAFGAMFITGWDAGKVVEDSLSVAENRDISDSTEYYSRFYHLRLTVLLLSSIMRFGVRLGINGESGLYALLVVIQCIVFLLIGIMIYDYLNTKNGKKAAIFGTLVYEAFVGLSPYVYIVYTDSIGALFPVLIMWLAWKIPDERYAKKMIKWLLVIFTASFGYFIKPTVFIVYIAIGISFFIHHLIKVKDNRFKTDLLVGAMILILPILFIVAGKAVIASSFERMAGIEIDESAAASLYHLLAVGHNDEYDGTVSVEDNDNTYSILDANDRKVHDKELFFERVKNLGFGGLGSLYVRKLSIAYGDGAFGYAITGTDYIDKILFKDNAFNSLVRKVYWPGRGRYFYYVNFAQFIWLGVICSCLFLGVKDEQSFSYALSIIGITVFLLLFEVQARYLLVMAPVFAITATEVYFALWKKK